MALNYKNSYLSALVENSADAQSNLYEVIFYPNTDSPNASLTDAESSALTVRCKGFTPPIVRQLEYPVKFITAYIDRPAAKVQVDRQFSLEFRVDANYKVYKTLLDQQGVTFNAAHSYVATNIDALKDKLFSVKVKTVTKGVTSEEVDVTKDLEPMFEFKNCYISEIEPLKFNSANSQPIVVRITCKYLEGVEGFSEYSI